MNKFVKYCPNVYVAECEEEYKKGDIIELTTKYGKLVKCEVYNFLGYNFDYKPMYSIVRLDEKSYAERKAEKYNNASIKNTKKRNEYLESLEEERSFLTLGEPVKVGHHSEKRHRALLDRTNKKMVAIVELESKAEEEKDKAEYWEKKAKEITLATPESLAYFTFKLEEAQRICDSTRKEINGLKKKIELAEKLWG